MEKTRYKIEYADGVEEALKKINKTMRDRIKKGIEERLTMLPDERGKALVREWQDHRRLRVGRYRVIYKVIRDRFIVFIVEVDHRSKVYKKL